MNFKRVYGYLTQTARYVLLLGAAWFITTNANAQKLNFAHLTVKDGLSKNSIIDITRRIILDSCGWHRI